VTFQPKPARFQNLLIIILTYGFLFYAYGFDTDSIIVGLLILPYCLYLTIFGLAIYVTLLQDKMVIEPSFSKWLFEKGIGKERIITIRYERITGLDKTRWLGGFDMVTIHATAENRRRRKFGIFWKTLREYDRFEEELLRRVPLNCRITSGELRQRFFRIRQVRPQ